MHRSILAIVGGLTLATGAAQAWKDQCESFVPNNLPEVTLVKSTYYETGQPINFTGLYTSLATIADRPFCRVQLLVHTNKTTGNFANSEVWLPDTWTSRLVGVGNGGWSGGLSYAAMYTDVLSKDAAAFSTNTGHNSTSSNATWAANNPEGVIDFGWRAMHMTTVASKAITAQYYGKPADRNYYIGCSTGGRQGLKSIQRFPEDFDGIVIGSPANPMSRLLPWELHTTYLTRPVGSPQWISSDLWAVIHKEVLKQCDAIDGVSDGVVSDPLACERVAVASLPIFIPEALTCRPGGNTSECLNLDQIAALRKIYADYYETNQTFVFSRTEPGGELFYRSGLQGNVTFPIPEGYYKYMVVNDTTWDPSTLDFETIKLGQSINPGDMDVFSPNVTAFAQRGGKVLHYVGYEDQLITAGNSIRWYESVKSFLTANTQLDPDDVYRLFPVPGLGHCTGGDGANGFGAHGQRAAGQAPAGTGPEYDIIDALFSWVEEGRQPAQVVAAKWNGNNSTLGLDYTRLLCNYPKKAVFTGGDESSADSFRCQ